MEPLCHRCGATLAAAETFCSNCGAPQLRIEEGIEGVEAFNAASPRPVGASEPRDPSWKDAILVAIIFAVPVGLLCSNVIPIPAGLFFPVVIGGGVGAVHLYRRRAATALLTPRVGLRIGLLLGLAAGVLSATADGLQMVVQRFALHNPAAPDKYIETLVQPFLMSFAQNPKSQAQLPDFYAALASPDGKAAVLLFSTFCTSFAILMFSSLGGALGAKFFSARRIGIRNS